MASPTGTSLDSESLFSLELVVDKLFLQKKVVCRFPAIAFRLLDFPTLMVYHVEPQMAESIKAKIAADAYYKPAPQLHELQDKDGCFPIKKGKSSLFRVAANSLLSHLTNTPLYVMIIDTFPETPKLLGNSTIGLDSTMESVYDDICKLGVSVPSVHGEKGVYKIYNLMGAEIGQVALGLRLLSLGVGLLSHIPDRALVKLAKKEPSVTTSRSQQKEDADVILEDLETIDKTVQVAISRAEPQMHGRTQTDMAGMLQDASVQTQKKQRKKPRQADRSALNIEVCHSEEFEDIFVTNAVCPPPLYYNSEAETKPTVLRLLQQPEMEDAESGSDESLSTIRHEDKFPDSDDEFQEEDPKPEKLLRENHAPRKQADVVSSWMNKTQAGTKKEMPGAASAFANFPVLNALLQEIATLPGVQGTGLQAPLGPAVSRATPSAVPKSPRAKSARHITAEPKSGDAGSRISSPRRTHKAEPAPGAQGAQSVPVTATAPAEPKQKGWMRKEPPAGVKKTKLAYGMTNTQRLRLAKGNPELLKTLEKTEQERLQKRRAEQLNKYPWLRRDSSFTKLGTADLSTEISKHPEDGTTSLVPKLDLQGTENGARAGSELKRHKKPVPTPRLSLSLTDKEKPLLTPRPRPSRVKLQMSVVEDQSHSDHRSAAADQDNSASHSSRSHKSIEVHVPSAATDDDQAESEATSVHGSELDQEEAENIMGKTRTIHTPGFPHESFDTTGHSSIVRQFSEDLEGENLTSTFGEEPALKKVVEKYSDSDSARSMTAPGAGIDVGVATLSGEDLGLRRVVETYSDYSEPEPSQHSDDRSYHSAHSQWSERSGTASNGVTANNNLRLKAGVPNPPSSTHSPITAESMHVRQAASGIATREPIAGSSSTTDNRRAWGASYDTMAHMSKSALTMDSSGTDEHDRATTPRMPKASPRRSVERVASSLHTESISSYAPSEGENLTPLSPGAEYSSDNFEDDDSCRNEAFPEPRHVREIRLAPEAKLGYTWT